MFNLFFHKDYDIFALLFYEKCSQKVAVKHIKFQSKNCFKVFQGVHFLILGG